MSMAKKYCIKDINNKLIIDNANIFEKLHLQNSIKLLNWYLHINDLIIIPVTINICVNTKKLKINFIKYCKYIVDILNDGFSGNLESKYKNMNKNNNESFIYNIAYIKQILEQQQIKNSDKNAKIIFNYINKCYDTNIKFYLESIVFHDNFIEEDFINNNTEYFINKIHNNGFRIKNEHIRNLNINIIAFRCSTLGVSIFPWIKYLNTNIPDYMQVYIDYCTIHPDIANNNFNNCRTLIHEVGHIFGLRHTFNNTIDTFIAYEIILGKIFYQNKIFDSINKNKQTNINELDHSKNNIQLYPDISIQHNPTIYDPFIICKFPFTNNYPNNFACFMDYSPDSVLTHFTYSQSKIMHYMIKLFKPYLIKQTLSKKKFINNCTIKVYINYKSFTSVQKKIYSKSYFFIKYDNENNFEYKIDITDHYPIDQLYKYIYI